MCSFSMPSSSHFVISMNQSVAKMLLRKTNKLRRENDREENASQNRLLINQNSIKRFGVDGVIGMSVRAPFSAMLKVSSLGHICSHFSMHSICPPKRKWVPAVKLGAK